MSKTDNDPTKIFCIQDYWKQDISLVGGKKTIPIQQAVKNDTVSEIILLVQDSRDVDRCALLMFLWWNCL